MMKAIKIFGRLSTMPIKMLLENQLLCGAVILTLVFSGCSSKKQEEETPAAGTAEAVETEENAEEAPEAASTDTEPSPTEAVSTQAPVSSSGAVVKYIKTVSCPVLDAPNGKEVATMTKGEHVLVWSEGEWSKTPDGRFISNKHLSEKGVARERTPSVWNPGVAH